jgi:selenoprotein W-related protein
VSLTAELVKAFESEIKSISLLPSSGGVFEVTVNDELIYSKKSLGRHANAGEVRNAVAARLQT